MTVNHHRQSPQDKTEIIQALPAHSETGITTNPRGELLETGVLEQSLLLTQPKSWSRAIVLSIVALTSIGISAAFIFQIDEAVPALGKLEPLAKVKDVQAPVGGVVKEVLVQEGQTVQAGEVLLRLDPTAATATKESLTKIKESLEKENAYYREVMTGTAPTSIDGNVPVELILLTRNRTELANEIQLLRLQLLGGSSAGLSPEQQLRVETGRLENQSRIATAELETAQIRRQLAQAQSELISQNSLLALDEQVLQDFTNLNQEGGIARLQVTQQQQRVISRRGEIARINQEIARLQSAIAQGGQRVQNTTATAMLEVQTRIAQSQQRIAEIDSQLQKVIVENAKRIAEADSQIAQAEQTLQYQNITAPSAGTVFDLQAKNAGFVVNSAAPVLKIVPQDGLVARVFITNRDIGFVRPGMEVDIRIDSFPFSEFGDVKGKLVEIGSDALPPDQVYPFFRFPAKVVLEKQNLQIRGQSVTLQSGMSITANIRVRKRSVASFFTDIFTNQIAPLETVR